METFIGNKLNSVLQKEVKHFRNYMLDIDYEEFKDYPKDKMFSLYIYSLLDNPIGLKKVKNICISKGINAKDFNEFIYLSLKWKRKQELGLYSWYEINELDIDFEDIKDTTLKFTVL